MDKIDLKKDLQQLYNPSAKVISVVEVPPLQYLMMDGAGDPNTSPLYQSALEMLYAVSYTLKFKVKKEGGVDYTVMPLEGLWWTDDPSRFNLQEKDLWKWTAMILQPDFVTPEQVQAACAEVERKKGVSTAELRFESYREGLAVQIMHIGPYSAEQPTIARLHTYISENGFALNGKHHEIYLSDPRRNPPEKLKTVIRQPVRRI